METKWPGGYQRNRRLSPSSCSHAAVLLARAPRRPLPTLLPGARAARGLACPLLSPQIFYSVSSLSHLPHGAEPSSPWPRPSPSIEVTPSKSKRARSSAASPVTSPPKESSRSFHERFRSFPSISALAEHHHELRVSTTSAWTSSPSLSRCSSRVP